MMCISDLIYFHKMKKLRKNFEITGLVGCGWLPSPAYSIIQADGLVDIFGLHITRTGSITKKGRNETWRAWPPGSIEENGSYHAEFTGKGKTICEAVLRCLIEMHTRGQIRGGLYSRYYYDA